MTEVGHEAGAQSDVQAGSGGQASGHLGRAARVASAEPVHLGYGVAGQPLLPAQLVQVAHGQFEYVGFFQFADVFALGLQGVYHQLLEFFQAPVDSGTAFAFEHWFHNLEKTKKQIY